MGWRRQTLPAGMASGGGRLATVFEAQKVGLVRSMHSFLPKTVYMSEARSPTRAACLPRISPVGMARTGIDGRTGFQHGCVRWQRRDPKFSRQVIPFARMERTVCTSVNGLEPSGLRSAQDHGQGEEALFHSRFAEPICMQ